MAGWEYIIWHNSHIWWNDMTSLRHILCVYTVRTTTTFHHSSELWKDPIKWDVSVSQGHCYKMWNCPFTKALLRCDPQAKLKCKVSFGLIIWLALAHLNLALDNWTNLWKSWLTRAFEPSGMDWGPFSTKVSGSGKESLLLTISVMKLDDNSMMIQIRADHCLKNRYCYYE